MNPAKQDLLVMAAKRGNHHAFEALFKEFNKPLLRYAYRICQSESLAQEAAQNTWLKLSKNLSQLEKPAAFQSWIFKTARWAVLDLVRKHRYEQQDAHPPEQSTFESVSDLDRTEWSLGLRQLINRLPSVERQVIHLFYLEGFTLTEISTALDKPVGTVKSTLHRARGTLRDQMAGFPD